MSTRGPGRPPEASITIALRRAAERALLASAPGKLSIDGLATEVGTTRQSFYRRYPSLAHLVFEIVRDTHGPGQAVDTGSVEHDLLAVQRESVAMFRTPLFANNLPGILDAIRLDPALAVLYESEFVRPRRERIAALLNVAVQRGELPALSAGDAELAYDLLSGPILARALLPGGGGLDEALVLGTVAATLRYLQAAPHANG